MNGNLVDVASTVTITNDWLKMEKERDYLTLFLVRNASSSSKGGELTLTNRDGEIDKNVTIVSSIE